MTASLKDRVGSTRVLWVLVDMGGHTRIAAPQGFAWPELEVDSSRWEHSLEDALPAVLDFLGRHPDWGALVSVLRGGASHPLVQKQLPPGTARELRDQEHDALRDLGMHLPLGEWAQPSKAVIYWLEKESV